MPSVVILLRQTPPGFGSRGSKLLLTRFQGSLPHLLAFVGIVADGHHLKPRLELLALRHRRAHYRRRQCFGGHGNVKGVLGGVLLLTVIQVGLAIVNVPSFYVGMIGGVIILSLSPLMLSGSVTSDSPATR